MAVEINIDLDSEKAHGKIQSLRADLKSLNENVDIDFNVDKDLKDAIEEITNDLKEIDIDVDYDDLERAAALKAMLQGDIEADLNVDMDEALQNYKDGLDPPDGGSGGINHDEQAKKFKGLRGENSRLKQFTKKIERSLGPNRDSKGTFTSGDYFRRFLQKQRNGGFSGISVDLDDLQTDVREKVNVAHQLKGKLGDQGYGKVGDPLGVEDYDEDRMQRYKDLLRGRKESGSSGRPSIDIDRDNLPKIKNRRGLNARKRGSLIGRFKKKLRSLVPSMNTFYTLFAAILPLLVGMGTQLAGVAASMGSVAIAGGSILALGLVGHGEDMASSWKKAKEQLSTLKEEMFEVFQPTMQTFAPIQARFFEIMPEQLNKVATAMESLTVYSDTLFASFAGLTDFMVRFFNIMTAQEGAMSQLAMRFGEIIGTNILDFFSWLVEEAYNSQEILIQLGNAFHSVLGGIYQFSMIIAQVASGFGLLGQIFEWVGKLLNNKIVIAVLAFIGALGGTIWAVTTLVGVMTALVSLWAGGLVATIISSTKLLAGYIFRTLAAVTANYALAASIANVVAFATMGIGALLGMAAAASAVNGMNAEMGVDTSGIGQSGMPGGNLGGGMGAGAGGGSTQTIINQGDTYNMEVNGDVDNPTEQGLRDMIASEGAVSGARETPSPGA